MLRHIPNFVTCLNLLSGCIALSLAYSGDLENAAYFVLLSAAFDFLDGMLARILNAYSDIGKELDSLADMVSFGVVPGVIVYQLLSSGLASQGLPEGLKYLSFIIPIFSALRLAKFNIDTRQTENFIGLATPANTLFFIALPFIQEQGFLGMEILLQPIVLVFLSIGMSYLLVAEIPLFSLKFKSMRFAANDFRYFLLISSLILIGIFKFAAIPLIIVIYILLSIIYKKKFSTL